MNGQKEISVYIASPYTKGDQGENVRRQMVMATKLISHNLIPFIPLLYHFQHMHSPESYETWMQLDNYWIGKCDALLRLDGESKGADIEVKEAQRLGIKVFFSLREIVDHYNVYDNR